MKRLHVSKEQTSWKAIALMLDIRDEHRISCYCETVGILQTSLYANEPIEYDGFPGGAPTASSGRLATIFAGDERIADLFRQIHKEIGLNGVIFGLRYQLRKEYRGLFLDVDAMGRIGP